MNIHISVKTMKKAGTTSRIFLLEYFNTQECLDSSQACKNLQSRRNFQLIRILVFEMKASQCRVVYVLESFTKKKKEKFLVVVGTSQRRRGERQRGWFLSSFILLGDWLFIRSLASVWMLFFIGRGHECSFSWTSIAE